MNQLKFKASKVTLDKIYEYNWECLPARLWTINENLKVRVSNLIPTNKLTLHLYRSSADNKLCHVSKV